LTVRSLTILYNVSWSPFASSASRYVCVCCASSFDLFVFLLIYLLSFCMCFCAFMRVLRHCNMIRSASDTDRTQSYYNDAKRT